MHAIWGLTEGHLTLVLAIVSSLTGALGASLAFLQMRATRQTVMHDVYFRLRERYTNPEVNHALVRLHNYRDKHGDGFADLWYAGFIAKEQEATQLNADRRLVSSFFGDLVRAYEMRALTPTLAAALASVSGLQVFLESCMPLNRRYYGPTSGDKAVALLKRLQRKSRPAFFRT